MNIARKLENAEETMLLLLTIKERNKINYFYFVEFRLNFRHSGEMVFILSTASRKIEKLYF